MLKVLKEFIQKSLRLVAGIFLATVLLTACGRKEEILAPKHNYSGRPVYTAETESYEQAGRNILLCSSAGMLTEIYNHRHNNSIAVNVFDRNTDKPVFCDPATGKVFESK